MGVPFFYHWIKHSNFKGIIRRNVPQNVSSLLFDLNGMIHGVAQLVYAYGEHHNPERRKLIAKASPSDMEAQFHEVLGRF